MAHFDGQGHRLLQGLLPHIPPQPSALNGNINEQPVKNQGVIPNGGQVPMNNPNGQVDAYLPIRQEEAIHHS